MSRHRAVRNLDLDEELDDAAFSDEDQEEYPGITHDQQVQLSSGLSSIQAIVGQSAGISDKEIKDALWYYYFDQDKAVAYLLEQQHKKNAAKEKAVEQAQKKKAQASKPSTPLSSRPGTPTKAGFKSKPPVPVGVSKTTTASSSATKQPPLSAVASTSALSQDLKGMGLDDEDYIKEDPATLPTISIAKEKLIENIEDPATLPTISIAKEKLIENIKQKEQEAAYRPVLSMVVIGHVDAGKSTLMGRMLAELGEMTQKAVTSNQRQAEKLGKASFGYAWAFDARPEERGRGVTIDIGIDSFSTPQRRFTLLDAPGHRDFIPNMISGASQADTAMLVVDAARGAFESGFNEGGQTREHALLVRSFGVQQLVVAVNKLDAVDWSEDRFRQIVDQLEPFLVQAGYAQSKLVFVPCGAMSGENLVERRVPELQQWYNGKTLIQTLDELTVPERALEAPLRIPLSNVFKGQTSGPSGLGVSGRIESGLVQVGERLAVLPGDETAVVKNIEEDGELLQYATAGANVTLYLAAIDPLYVNVGCVLCEPDLRIPLVSSFTAQVVTFELKFPLTAGSAVELFYHSKEIPATIAKIEATLDKATGEVIKHSPRMISKGSSARITVRLRPSGSAGKAASIPLEAFARNKNMGRILLRRGGETVAAGIVLTLLD